MNLWENFKMALDSIRSHKMRAFLTMLGIVIGVASVLIIVAIGEGGTDRLTESFAGAGNTINVMPSQDVQMSHNGQLPPDFITRQDIRDLEDLPSVKRVATASYESLDVRFREKKSEGTMVLGINNNVYMDMSDESVAQGRRFQAADFRRGNAGAIISHKVKEDLFPDKQPVGQIIRVGQQPVRIIGVLDSPDGIFGSLQQSQVYLPDQTWRNVIGKNQINQVVIQAESADQIRQAGDAAIQVLERNHRTEGDYEVMNLDQLVKGMNQVARIMTIVIGSIGGISLLVGGIGVMNIMLVSVTERTREIGIRMSLGATRGQILTQFLIESVTLSVLGGIVGILLAYGATSLIALLSPLPAVVSPAVATGAVLFSILFGVVFGLLPANKASRLNPIECLRYE
ncbi:ABC transporter permease [Paludifilum halophilum]|uniref:Macrolide ABC transporter permease n=1 Tax=Paludifilum halophilum TaxID=1642702 RepID=A0A235B3T9_9BACL|nr:ABC transporter permease [Paludifilum halophilum]OYD06577.1 macrolide ABC transporter permease [Paludifilum halophilum]